MGRLLLTPEGWVLYSRRLGSKQNQELKYFRQRLLKGTGDVVKGWGGLFQASFLSPGPWL